MPPAQGVPVSQYTAVEPGPLTVTLTCSTMTWAFAVIGANSPSATTPRQSAKTERQLQTFRLLCSFAILFKLSLALECAKRVDKTFPSFFLLSLFTGSSFSHHLDARNNLLE